MEKKKYGKQRDDHIVVLIGMIAAVLILMAFLKGKTYYSLSNLRSMIFQFPEFGILAFGMMVCMIAGGIDLSLVGIMNLAGVVAAIMIKNGSPIFLGVLVAVLIGAACGAFNGFVYAGLSLAITGGPAVNALPDSFKSIANGSMGPIPYVLFIFIIVALLVAFVMKYTTFGHEIYFLGSNKVAAKYSGINTLKVTVLTHMFSGILGGISGIVITSHLNSAKSSNGETYTLMSLLIVVLGGVNPDGGRGRVLGVTLAIILLQLISNAFTIMRAPDTMKTFVNGVLLIAALILDVALEKRNRKRM